MSGMFYGGFDSIDGVLKDFDEKPDALDGATVHLAWYGYGSYEGGAFVLYEKDGKLYEVSGGHCSCNGLEGQWLPEETSWEAVAHVLRKGNKFDYPGISSYYDDSDAAYNRLVELVDSHVPKPAEGIDG